MHTFVRYTVHILLYSTVYMYVLYVYNILPRCNYTVYDIYINVNKGESMDRRIEGMCLLKEAIVWHWHFQMPIILVSLYRFMISSGMDDVFYPLFSASYLIRLIPVYCTITGTVSRCFTVSYRTVQFHHACPIALYAKINKYSVYTELYGD